MIKLRSTRTYAMWKTWKHRGKPQTTRIEFAMWKIVTSKQNNSLPYLNYKSTLTSFDVTFKFENTKKKI